MKNTDWFIFMGDNKKKDKIKFPDGPPWRQRTYIKDSYIPDKSKDSNEIDIVNAAIYLKRPILVTGKPGLGKTYLAHAIANELGLEIVKWEITTKTVLNDGLYVYDAIARLQAASLKEDIDISKFLFLSPLGYAFAQTKKPVVLLIDEIDKSDIDLPNDLLHIFEEMSFSIKELERADTDGEGISIYPIHSRDNKILIKKGKVSLEDSKNFPIIIMTSNDEREFPPAFLRRCLRLTIQKPDKERLIKIVNSHFDKIKENIKNSDEVNKIIEEFLKLRDEDGLTLSNDQLLHAMHLLFENKINILDNKKLKNTIFESLE